MRELYNRLVQFIGYTIMFQDTINNIDPWEITKRTHIVLYKYLGRFKHDNSLKMRVIWRIKIR
jgi:hypothetical protein